MQYNLQRTGQRGGAPAHTGRHFKYARETSHGPSRLHHTIKNTSVNHSATRVTITTRSRGHTLGERRRPLRDNRPCSSCMRQKNNSRPGGRPINAEFVGGAGTLRQREPNRPNPNGENPRPSHCRLLNGHNHRWKGGWHAQALQLTQNTLLQRKRLTRPAAVNAHKRSDVSTYNSADCWSKRPAGTTLLWKQRPRHAPATPPRRQTSSRGTRRKAPAPGKSPRRARRGNGRTAARTHRGT